MKLKFGLPASLPACLTLVRVLINSSPSPINRRIPTALALVRGLVDGWPVEDRLVVLGIQLHEERFPFLNKLIFNQSPY